MKGNKTAVTGATGLVGSHMVAELIRRGCTDITLPVRDTSRLAKLYDTLRREGVDRSGVRLNAIEAELTNPVETKEALDGVDLVFNCAAAVSLGAMDEWTLIDGNQRMARNVVNACLAHGVRRLVHVSSIATLGAPPEPGMPIDEGMVPSSLDGMSPYHIGKLLAENEAMRGAACGLTTVVVNPAVILGAGDWSTGSSAMIPALAAGVPFYTEGVTAIVDVRDVARAMADLAECDTATGERYILAGANISYRELLTLAAHSAGRRPPRIEAGSRMLGTAWRGAQAWGRISGTRPLFTSEIAAILLRKTRYSNEKIKNRLNFEFTPAENTIDRVIKQYIGEKSHGNG